MDNNYFLGFIVVIREMMQTSFSRRFLPSCERSKSVPDFGPVHGRSVVPAVVTTSRLVDCKVVAAACRTDKLARLVAGFELLKVVKDGERHSAARREAPSIMAAMATGCKKNG